jgi:hypothetical protein
MPDLTENIHVYIYIFSYRLGKDHFSIYKNYFVALGFFFSQFKNVYTLLILLNDNKCVTQRLLRIKTHIPICLVVQKYRTSFNINHEQHNH